MSKSQSGLNHSDPEPIAPDVAAPRIAIVSNPASAGKLAQLDRIRAFCASRPGIFHYEVDTLADVGAALRAIGRTRPALLVVNGGDATVQAVLTEIHNGCPFASAPPPVAVLPNGTPNLIASDLGARGDALEALERLVGLAGSGLGGHLVVREPIALSKDGWERPAIGMFLGGAGVADAMLYCRNRIYPLGLPGALSHALTVLAAAARHLLCLSAGFLPPRAEPLKVSTAGRAVEGRCAMLVVTTLDTPGLPARSGKDGGGRLKLLAVEERPSSLAGALFAGLAGRIGRSKLAGVHFEEADEVRIEGERSSLILDGEMFEAEAGKPFRLRAAPPLSFVRFAA